MTPELHAKLVEEKIRELGGDLVEDFDGKNCDECPGWDGSSRRCECGNRRVSWSLAIVGHTFTRVPGRLRIDL